MSDERYASDEGCGVDEGSWPATCFEKEDLSIDTLVIGRACEANGEKDL